MNSDDPDLEDLIPSSHAPGLGKGKGRKAAPGWTNNQLAIILGVSGPAFGRYVSGERYPETRTLVKIERIFGWPAAEQIQLVPEKGHDMRYAMKFIQILNEWKAANPRRALAQDLKVWSTLKAQGKV